MNNHKPLLKFVGELQHFKVRPYKLLKEEKKDNLPLTNKKLSS